MYRYLRHLISARIRRMREGNSFSLFVSPHLGGEVPHLHPIILPLVPCPFRGPYPIPIPQYFYWLHVLPGGRGGGTPSPGQGWRTPQQRVGFPLERDGVPPSPQDKTAEWVIATRWAICLLRSRRRTFLFYIRNSSCDTLDTLFKNVGLFWSNNIFKCHSQNQSEKLILKVIFFMHVFFSLWKDFF